MSAVLQSSKMEEGLVNEEVIASSASTAKKNEAFYGVDGDVELNEAGLANVLVQEHKTQKEMLFKTIIFGLFMIIAILAVSNLGMSFASQELTDTGDIFEATVPSDSGEAARKLSRQCHAVPGEGNPFKCVFTSYVEVPKSDAKQIIQKCRQDKTVMVEIRNPPTPPTRTTICTEGLQYCNEFMNGNNPEANLCGTTLRSNPDESTYTIAVDALMCYVDNDCDDGLVCSYNEDQIPTAPDLPILEYCDADGNCSGNYVCILSSNKCSECDPSADPNAATNPCDGDTPVCIDNNMGGGYCGCDTDAQCNEALGETFTCGGPICVPDITHYCFDGNHNHQWGCGVCIVGS